MGWDDAPQSYCWWEETVCVYGFNFFQFWSGWWRVGLMTRGRVLDEVRVPSLGLASNKLATDLYCWVILIDVWGGKFSCLFFKPGHRQWRCSWSHCKYSVHLFSGLSSLFLFFPSHNTSLQGAVPSDRFIETKLNNGNKSRWKCKHTDEIVYSTIHIAVTYSSNQWLLRK